ncbi:Hcp family type VI secretion system effector [Burkholderia sp. PU8-34]
MGVAMFMKVDGVSGESADAQHKGWTDIQTFSWGASQPGAMASGSGGNAGKASFNDLVVAAYMDKGTPAIIKYCANGKHLPTVEISACKTGGSQVEFMRVTLQEVLVTSAQLAGVDPGDTADRLLMHYGFQAAKVKKQYWQQNDNGGKGAEVSVGWNIKENTEM